MRHRFLSLLLALLLTATALAGCGGEVSETTADTASADTAAGLPILDSEAALERINRKN